VAIARGAIKKIARQPEQEEFSGHQMSFPILARSRGAEVMFPFVWGESVFMYRAPPYATIDDDVNGMGE
jgi:hypothetical protein